jgi:predicted nucleotidyltransferase
MPFKKGLAEKRKMLLQDELERIIPKIIELEIERLILFGSLASDSISKSSDIDLIVIKKTNKKFLDRLEEFYIHLKPQVGIDILVYTPDEFEEMKHNNRFIKSALKNGRILYER